jgi:hypothetical protein
MCLYASKDAENKAVILRKRGICTCEGLRTTINYSKNELGGTRLTPQGWLGRSLPQGEAVNPWRGRLAKALAFATGRAGFFQDAWGFAGALVQPAFFGDIQARGLVSDGLQGRIYFGRNRRHVCCRRVAGRALFFFGGCLCFGFLLPVVFDHQLAHFFGKPVAVGEIGEHFDFSSSIAQLCAALAYDFSEGVVGFLLFLELPVEERGQVHGAGENRILAAHFGKGRVGKYPFASERRFPAAEEAFASFVEGDVT